VRCSVLQCVAVCCSVLQCVAVCCSALHTFIVYIQKSALKSFFICSVLQCVAVCCSVLQCVTLCCSVLHTFIVYIQKSALTSFLIPTSHFYMRWLRLVGSLKLYVSFAKEPYKRDDILQKRPIILKSLLIVAIP